MSAQPPTAPPGASTATKVLLFVAFILGILAAVTWPTGVSPVVGQYLTIGATISAAAGGGIHSIWDHTP